MAMLDSATVVQELFAAVNDGDIDRMATLVSDDFVVHTPVPGIGTGQAGMRQLMSTYFDAFPEQRVEVNDIIADGDLVAVRHTHYVTHGGEFVGLPPTGKQAVVEGIEMFRVSGGKVNEMWHQDDMLGLMQQLGAIPGPD